MHKLISSIQTLYPSLTFTAGNQYCWSPETSEIMYIASDNDLSSTDVQSAEWSLLHETGHALLNHENYHSDVELLRIEVDAWERAKALAHELGMTIDEDHVQDCLDTYRDWLDKRSICPTCRTKSIQTDTKNEYRCFNCHTSWRVSSNRFGRSYRQTNNSHTSVLV